MRVPQARMRLGFFVCEHGHLSDRARLFNPHLKREGDPDLMCSWASDTITTEHRSATKIVVGGWCPGKTVRQKDVRPIMAAHRLLGHQGIAPLLEHLPFEVSRYWLPCRDMSDGLLLWDLNDSPMAIDIRQPWSRPSPRPGDLLRPRDWYPRSLSFYGDRFASAPQRRRYHRAENRRRALNPWDSSGLDRGELPELWRAP